MAKGGKRRQRRVVLDEWDRKVLVDQEWKLRHEIALTEAKLIESREMLEVLQTVLGI